MKQKKLVSLIGAVFLIISIAALITGCPQANGGISTKNIVEFDSLRIKCQNKNSFPYTDVTNGSQIQEKDLLKFEAILTSGKIVENWYINDIKQEYETDASMVYRVEASDIVYGKIKTNRAPLYFLTL